MRHAAPEFEITHVEGRKVHWLKVPARATSILLDLLEQRDGDLTLRVRDRQVLLHHDNQAVLEVIDLRTKMALSELDPPSNSPEQPGASPTDSIQRDSDPCLDATPASRASLETAWPLIKQVLLEESLSAFQVAQCLDMSPRVVLEMLEEAKKRDLAERDGRPPFFAEWQVRIRNRSDLWCAIWAQLSLMEAEPLGAAELASFLLEPEAVVRGALLGLCDAGIVECKQDLFWTAYPGIMHLGRISNVPHKARALFNPGGLLHHKAPFWTPRSKKCPNS